MAVAGTLLTSSNNVTPAATFNTASISPGANRLILAAVAGVDNDVTTAPAFTLTGNGLTWVSVDRITTGVLTLQLFRAMGASPSAGAVTIDADVTTLGCGYWGISEYTGVDTSGTNGSGAVGNVAQNGASSTNTLTVTLPAFGSANNGTFGAYVAVNETPAAFTFTPGSGFTELAETVAAAFGGVVYFGVQSEWKASNDTGVDVTTSLTSNDILGISVEIIAASAGLSIPIAYNHYAKLMQAN